MKKMMAEAKAKSDEKKAEKLALRYHKVPGVVAPAQHRVWS